MPLDPPDASPADQTAAPDDAAGAVDPQSTVQPSPRSMTLSLAVIATSLLVAALSLLPAPYAISSPGPTRDTLGLADDGEPLIVVTGRPTFPSEGQLRLTTVSVAGGPEFPVNAVRVLRGWFEGASQVRPVEDLFDAGVTQEQIRQHNAADMITSQETAAVAALEQLGIDVPTMLTVAEVAEGSGAVGVVEVGDVLRSVDGTEIGSFTELTDLLAEVPVGRAVELGVDRDGRRLTLDVVLADKGDGTGMLGVVIDPTFDLPFPVEVRIDDIGGPSAGMMFALGIIDSLTEPDETGGEIIAGTGTVDVYGTIGPIGGIRHKLVGAVRDGATWFLASQANCAEVVGNVPDGLTVVQVGTLDDAVAAVEAIGQGRGGTLATCSA